MNSLHALGSTGKSGFEGAHSAKTAAAQLDGSNALDWFGMMPNPLASQPAGATFASLFAGASNAASPNAQNADPVAQLTSLLQSGTPMSTIVDRLAQQIAGAVAHALPGQANAASNARLQSSLVKSIANALAPPGNAPPGTAAEQAAALAQRLQTWIAGIAGDAKTTAGQQNDISGKLLDAKSAKDIPAQRKTETASTPVDPAALTHALLSSVAAALAPAQSNGSAPANPQPLPATANAASSAPSSAQASAPPSITIANAPDVLARMLVRAAGVDARINGVAPAPATGNASSSIELTPAALAARFASAIASAAAGSQSGTQGNSSGSNSERDGSQPTLQSAQTPSGVNSAGAAAVAAPVSTTSFAAMTQTQTHTPVDANAIVEQVVKSMVMRTAQSGSSEIRLRLNPENLGEVTMKITVSGSSIDANVVAANSDVRNALISNHQHLAQSLSEAGLTLAGFSVDVSGGDAGRDQNRDRTSGFGRRYAVHEIGTADDSETAESSSTGPQLLPRTSLDLFNYLA